MKKTLSMITLAAFALMLLGSCTKINERLDNLEKKVDGIENEDIASIESQVQSIESSISDLKSIRDKVQAMSDPATGLNKRIEDLESFVSDVKKDYATKDWAKATFATMDEYEKTCDTVAKMALKVEGFDSSLKACAESLKGWVNGKFGGYYDIATIDAKLAELQEQVDGVDSLSAELAKTREEIDTAKSAIRAEYRAAITSAIETYDGKLTKALQDSIDNVNATIGTLAGRVGILETKVEALKGRVDSLENMIQSIKLVPAFSDGSVKVEDDTLFIDCIISPAEVVKALDSADFTILLNKVRTKAVSLDTVPIDSIKVFAKDILNGTVSINAYIPKFLAELGEESLTVAVNVKKDKSDYTTEFVPVNVIPAGALSSVFSVSATKKVRFSKGNLYAKKDNSGQWNWGFYDKQYEFLAKDMEVSGSVNEPQRIISETETEIHLFTWGYDEEKSVKPTGTEYVEGHTEDGETFTRNEDWGYVFGGGTSVWRTLSTEEWQYLFSYDGSERDGYNYDNPIRRSKYKYGVTVCSKPNCVVIAPDNWDINANPLKAEYSAEEWVAAEAAGLVCLPAAGGRVDYGEGSSNNVLNVGSVGDYWSSSAYNEEFAYIVGFDSNVVNPYHTLNFSSGFSVRLVTDVK